jgi:hypothetical protein
MKHTKEIYEQEAEAYAYGDKGCSYLKHYTNKVVVTRKEHPCLGLVMGDQPHIIPKGSKAVREEAIIADLGRTSSYVCLECLDKHIEDLHP